MEMPVNAENFVRMCERYDHARGGYISKFRKIYSALVWTARLRFTVVCHIPRTVKRARHGYESLQIF